MSDTVYVLDQVGIRLVKEFLKRYEIRPRENKEEQNMNKQETAMAKKETQPSGV